MSGKQTITFPGFTPWADQQLIKHLLLHLDAPCVAPVEGEEDFHQHPPGHRAVPPCHPQRLEEPGRGSRLQPNAVASLSLRRLSPSPARIDTGRRSDLNASLTMVV
jgi:hypothetical protein